VKEVEILVRPELIIFDMDGLMFDTERIAFISWRQAAINHGYIINEELFMNTVGSNLQRTKEFYVDHFGNEFPIEKIVEQRYVMAENLIKRNGVPAVVNVTVKAEKISACVDVKGKP